MLLFSRNFMKIRILLINLCLLSASVYLPLFSYSFFVISSSKNFQENNQVSKYKTILQKQISSQADQKIKAVKNGFMPLYFPVALRDYVNETGIYPIGSLPLTNTYLCDEGYGLIRYKTDRFGLRNKDSLWGNLFLNSNIFIIGDSIANSSCVGEEFTITSNLKSSTGLKSINLGVNGNSPFEYMAVTKTIIKPIMEYSDKKNIVILFLNLTDNDFANDGLKRYIKNLKPIVNKSGFGLESTKKYNKGIKALITKNYATSENKIISEIKKNAKNSQFTNNKHWKQGFLYETLTLYPLRLKLKTFSNTPSMDSINFLSEVCQGLCKPVVVYVPMSDYWNPEVKGIANKYKNHLKKESSASGIKFIDAEEVIDTTNLSDFAPKGPHLSIKGYKKVSDLITRKLGF